LRLRAIVDAAMETIIATDKSGVIVSVNSATRKMFGYERDEMLGRNVSMLMTEAQGRRHGDYIARYLGGGASKMMGQIVQLAARRKDGAVFPVEMTVSETTLNEERLFVGFLRDLGPIDEERRRVDALRAELFHVARLNDMGEVVAALAHQVGQPIAAILNFAAAHRRAATEADDAPGSDLVRKIETQARRAKEILERLRGFIEKRPVQRRVENVHKLIDDAIQLTLLRSKARIEYKPPPENEAGLRVFVDPILIGQVLVNLLRNADDAVMGEQDPRISVETTRGEAGLVRISVSDNGPGVDAGKAEDIFKPFVSSKKFGMGVGLSIGATIVESHGGKLSCRPNTPRGAIFEFTLPVYSGEAAPWVTGVED
jgi:two-component system sensor kinase FixL